MCLRDLSCNIRQSGCNCEKLPEFDGPWTLDGASSTLQPRSPSSPSALLANSTATPRQRCKFKQGLRPGAARARPGWPASVVQLEKMGLVQIERRRQWLRRGLQSTELMRSPEKSTRQRLPVGHHGVSNRVSAAYGTKQVKLAATLLDRGPAEVPAVASVAEREATGRAEPRARQKICRAASASRRQRPCQEDRGTQDAAVSLTVRRSLGDALALKPTSLRLTHGPRQKKARL